jgi:hypothetical protein
VLRKQFVAESAKIGHNLAESTKSINGFNQFVEPPEHEASYKNAPLKGDLSGKFRIGSIASKPYHGQGGRLMPCVTLMVHRLTRSP